MPCRTCHKRERRAAEPLSQVRTSTPPTTLSHSLHPSSLPRPLPVPPSLPCFDKTLNRTTLPHLGWSGRLLPLPSSARARSPRSSDTMRPPALVAAWALLAAPLAFANPEQPPQPTQLERRAPLAPFQRPRRLGFAGAAPVNAGTKRARGFGQRDNEGAQVARRQLVDSADEGESQFTRAPLPPPSVRRLATRLGLETRLPSTIVPRVGWARASAEHAR